ncbi:2-amino-4-hydroxy-6-hydroxymethyldihydropteridine diphosphokinase [Bellilinea caldifistulae]|uniref:2-amino-4-hydroxy-6- hydroxymethyldihydropteridine diphosphokinase n=1 Tax=Bellilinea caldifistulae TaxID=360411 RepID=UPI0009E1D228|nr:2-amino-4-hydroxy-6-hydroxymethyldihydropteridine diphosphokinase [Bellilinea caldifistulae]GAP11176.1 2-amino-4-hydroxy-6-hydroxymethyldihydropteridine diphosphokinase [Bellilinea caldifistulae]
MDQTFIKDLLVRGIIGISERERSQKQDILINMVLFGDISKAGQSDAIEDCINYRTVAKKTIAYVERAARYTVEALASDLARLCLEEPGVEGVRIRVEKPGAVRFAQSVGVEIERFHPTGQQRRHQAYISLGSNIAPRQNLIQAVQLLRQAVSVNAMSSVWESEAVGSAGPRFMNATAWISTDLDAVSLKEQVLRSIEEKLGRVRSEDKYAPRTIDLDILVFDEKVLDDGLWKQDFLAIPTAELRPDLLEEQTGRNLGEIAQSLKSHSSAVVVPDLDLNNV